MSYVITTISDIHFGAPDPDHLMDSLNKNFLKKLKKLPKLDLIVICGDLYDYVYNLQNISVKYSFMFMDKLVKLAKKKNAKIRVIRGTVFHDGKNQLDVFKFYEYDLNCDFKIIKNVEDEEIFENFNVLYIPEEYMKDKYEYYKEYLNKPDNHYKMIFGHGMFREVAFGKENEVTKSEAPIFEVNDLARVCAGPIIFGHIHIRTIIYNKVYYNGSFERWRQGEEESKGFYITLYNNKNDRYVLGFVENKDAKKYISIDISDLLLKYDEQQMIRYIDEVYKLEDIYKLRLDIDCEKIGDNDLIVKILKEYYSRHMFIDVNIKNDKISELKKESKENEELIDTYGYLFDNKMPIENKLTLFIKDRFQYNIDPDRVNQLLLQDNNIEKMLNDINNFE